MNRISTKKITLVALAGVMNIIGGQLALLFHLPIYCDSVGTILSGAMFGPLYGVIPGLISGIVNGMTTDIYSLYYMPPQAITGIMAGLLFQTRWLKKWYLPFGNVILTLPGTIVSSLITAALFGGVTSSGSSLIVMFLRHLGCNMVTSVCVVQFITEYADRFIAVLIVYGVLRILPKTGLYEERRL